MKPTILAVDDEPAILGLLSIALGAEGYRVLVAENIKNFKQQDAIEDVDIYLVDISLPDGNGLRLVKELRQNTDKGVIILSGRAEETDHVVGLEIGADDYVSKPFRIRELCSRVNAVYRRSRGNLRAPPAPAVAAPAVRESTPVTAMSDYEFDGFGLSLSARELIGPNGTEIELTTAEFDLLAGLLSRRGQVLSRDQLMNAIKGRDWECYDRAVDGLVSRLRRKLSVRPDKHSYIRTVHGVGYRFTG